MRITAKEYYPAAEFSHKASLAPKNFPIVSFRKFLFCRTADVSTPQQTSADAKHCVAIGRLQQFFRALERVFRKVKNGNNVIF